MKNLLYIGNKLARHGYSVTSIETLGPLLAEEYNVYFSSDKKSKSLRLMDMVSTFWRRRNEVDAVVIDTYSSLNFYYAVVIAQMARWWNIPYIPILRGGELPLLLRRKPRLAQLVFGGSYRNIAPSGYLQSAFDEAGYPTLLIPNFIDISRYPFRHRREVRPKFLWVRSFQKLYNPDLAIRLLARLVEDYPEAEMAMVGPDKDGSLDRCRRLAGELGVADRLTFTGLLSKEDWIAFSAGYDIFINTTNADNTPVSVMEAMALGFPVVTTNVGGLPFLFEDGKEGLMVPPREVEPFRAAIAGLLEEPERTGRISAAARRKAEQWDWQVVRRQWKQLFNGNTYDLQQHT